MFVLLSKQKPVKTEKKNLNPATAYAAVIKKSYFMYKILFVCIGNSARSQIAEAFLNKYGNEKFIAQSAGLEPGTLNPNVIQIMKEDSIDISNNKTKSVFDLFKKGERYVAVITVCDEASAERCPIFPGKVKRTAWSFSDPSTFIGSHAEILEQTRKVKDEIKNKVLEFISQASDVSYWI